MEQPGKLLLFGNWLMVLCGLCYLAWWVIAFRPPKPRSTPVTATLLVTAFVFGMVGVYIIGRSLTTPMETANEGIRGLWIVLSGIAAYVILLTVSAQFSHRQVTSELLIIIAWAVLELCALNFLYRIGGLTVMTAVVLSAIVLTAAAGSYVCYLLHYNLPYTAGYVDGCIPLMAAVIVMTAINLTAARTI